MRAQKQVENSNQEVVKLKRPKLLVVGVDAFSYEFFTEVLPQVTSYEWMFKKIQNGEMVRRRLEAFGHLNPEGEERDTPHTGPNWSSMYTGASPEVHGITDHGWQKDELDYSNIEKKTVFEEIDEVGYSQGVYSMPVTYPAPKLENGWSISGFPSPLGTEETYHPDEGNISYLAELPRNILHVRDELPKPGIESLEKWGDELDQEERQKVVRRTLNIEFSKVQNFIQLQGDVQADVLYYGSHAVDKICHMYPLSKDSNAVMSVYTGIGTMIKQLYKSLRPENFILVSDHGFEEGTRVHDKDGIMIVEQQENGTLEKYLQEYDEFKTSDVAEVISHVLKINPEWIGDDRETDYVRGDKEAIRERLKELGYI